MFLLVSQLRSSPRYGLICFLSSLTFVEVIRVMSSAYVTTETRSGGNGSLLIQLLKSMGKNAPTCGTHCSTFPCFDFLFR